MYSFMTVWRFGCPVCMLKPLVFVTKRSEHCVAYRGSRLLQKVWACGNTAKREKLGFCGFSVCGACIYGKLIPLIPYVVSDSLGKEECTKESVSIKNLYSIFVIRPTKSCTVKMIQKSSLNQTNVYKFLWLVYGNHRQRNMVIYDHQ